MANKYVSTFTLKNICEILDIEIPKEYTHLADFEFTNVAYAERFLNKDGAFFINAKSKEESEHKIKKAISEGIKFIFIKSEYADNPLLNEIPHIAVENPFRSVIKLSASIREKLEIKVVGITGSLGKTTTKDVVFSVLNYANNAMRSIGNQNTIFPLFENMQKMPLDVEYFVQEFGAATPRLMPLTAGACVPDVSIITNISDPHLDVFETRENILKEKLKLIKKTPDGCPAFLNYDDVLLKKAKVKDHPIISYAIDNTKADYHAENIKELGDTLVFDVVTKNDRTNVTMHARGKFNIYNALVAFAVGEWFGISKEDIVEGIAAFRSGGLRHNITNIGGYNLFIDCYNAAPASVVSDIEIMDNLPVGKHGDRVAVIGQIDRLGDQAVRLHIETAKEIGKTNVDRVFCFGDELSELLANELKKEGIESYYTNDRAQLNKWITEKVKRKDVALFKGCVVSLLSRTIDQVYGTSLHTISEHFEFDNVDDFRVKIIWEKKNHDAKLVALLKYSGEKDTLEIPGYVKGAEVFSIGEDCFNGNTRLKKAVIAEPIFNIAARAFKDCESLQEVKLPATLKAIESNAFADCKALEAIEIPEGTIEIGDGAFRGCDSLSKVTIPATVGRVGEDAFPPTCEVIRIPAEENKEKLGEIVKRYMRRRKRKNSKH